jgi:hypothetical protein
MQPPHRRGRRKNHERPRRGCDRDLGKCNQFAHLSVAQDLKIRAALNPVSQVARHGEKALEALVVEDNRTGERRTLEARTLFVFIRTEPNARWLGDHPGAGRSCPELAERAGGLATLGRRRDRHQVLQP